MKFDPQSIDRRVIYLFVLLALMIPLINNFTVRPVKLTHAQHAYDLVEQVKAAPGDIAFLAFDFGPSTKAENQPQAEVVMEHLMRRRIPIALFSVTPTAEPFLSELPEEIADRLRVEFPGEDWRYGVDWVNLGYRPGAGLLLQSLPKSKNLVELFKEDVLGNRLSEIQAFRNVKTLNNIALLGEFTGLVGVFSAYVQFFQKKDYRPVFVHGCTAITIPEAYIYLDSKQLDGLLEGIAGAAWYSDLLQQKFQKRKPDSSALINTMLGVAHLIIIFFIILGNAGALIKLRRGRSAA